jgi:hypothetical protein
LIYLPNIRRIGGINKGVEIKRIKNLGINPRSGGSPPKDRSVRAIVIFIFSDIRFDDDISLGVLIFNEKNKYIKIIK